MNAKRLFLQSFAVAIFVSLSAPLSAAPPQATERLRPPERAPEVVLLTAPDWIESNQPFDVAVTAAYAQGLSAIVVRYGEQAQRIPINGLRTASVVVRFQTRGAAAGEVTAFAVSTDGRTYYTVAQLEALNLWTKLGSKAVSLGWCTP